MSLAISYIKSETLNQAGDVINETSGVTAPLTGCLNNISERKRLTIKFDNIDDGYGTYQTIANGQLYINFAMFMPLGLIFTEAGTPNTGFNVRLPSSFGASQRVAMNFYSNGNPEPENCRNLTCTFISSDDALTTELEFFIELEYYNTFDENTYFNNVTKNNQWRFFSEYFNQQNFDVIPNSVYNTTKELRCIINLISSVNYKEEFVLTQQQNNTFNARSEWEFTVNGSSDYTVLSII
jgi:hypothetical protein